MLIGQLDPVTGLRTQDGFIEQKLHLELLHQDYIAKHYKDFEQ